MEKGWKVGGWARLFSAIFVGQEVESLSPTITKYLIPVLFTTINDQPTKVYRVTDLVHLHTFLVDKEFQFFAKEYVRNFADACFLIPIQN